MRLRTKLACMALAWLALPDPASADLRALDLHFTGFSPSTARDVNAAGQVVVEGVTDPLGNLPRRAILMPPHPQGNVLSFACYPICNPCASHPPPCGLEIGFTTWDRPFGITESGRLFGARYRIQLPQSTYPIPASWSPPGYGHQEYPPVPGGTAANGRVMDMNDATESVGILITPGLSLLIVIPYYWSAPSATPFALANLGSPEGPLPIRINEAGAIIGDRLGATPRAVIWPSAFAPAFAHLGELPGGATSHALDLDATGRVVGSSDDGSGAQVAVLWQPSNGAHAVVALPVPFVGGGCQAATAISETGGWIAGNCTTAEGDRRGVIWRDVGPYVAVEHQLRPLAGDADSAVYGLGGSQLAAGSSGDPPRAVLWSFESTPAVPALSARWLAVLVVALACFAAAAVRRAT